MYSLNEYAYLVGDAIRMRAYGDAIARIVRPDAVVVDIGAGGGVLSVLAARAGARRVYAIEAMPLGSAVRETAERCGVADRITFVHGMSTEVTLADRADVIVSDLHGLLPFFRAHLPSIIDARRRFLQPDGALIPASESLHAVLVDAAGLYERHVGVFDAAPSGVQMPALRRMAANRWYRGPRDDVHRIGPAAGIAALDYARMDDPNLDVAFDLECASAATAHGFCVWFDSVFAPGVELTNHPDADETAFGRAFFPFERPLDLRAGDRARIRLRASFADPDYVWAWTTDVACGSGAVHFQQSTFFGVPIR